MPILNEVFKTLLTALKISVVAGIIGFIVASILVGFGSDPVMLIIVNLIMLTLLLLIAKAATIDNMGFVGIITLLFSVAIVNSIIQLVLPALSPYLLNMVDFNVSALLPTIVYIGLAQIGLKKIGQ